MAFVVAAGIGRGGLLLVLRGAWPHGADGVGLAGRPPSRCSTAGWPLDAASLLFLSITSVLFLAAALYAVGYLAREAAPRTAQRRRRGAVSSNFPEAVFTGCLLLFLATMTLVVVSRHLGLMWVAVEATTLASAPLIYFHRHPRSLEATWKYLVICSVGIALALLGNFFLAVAAQACQRPTIAPDDRRSDWSCPAAWIRSG